ncbi:TRAP transporter small permease [Paenalcaligenes hominis]|uniref:TRAP transporter small permease n=1 Tax=Paenalcaligenes hominis TaxID=643674 RepID=UPI0035261CAB
MSEVLVEYTADARIDNSRLGRSLLRVSQLLAIIGGVIFLLLILITVISIIGRKLFALPVPGDIEIMQMAAASGCACFFAYCHITFNDLKVELLTVMLGNRSKAVLNTMASLGVAVFGFFLTWRTYAAAIATLESGESSAILAWPVAWFQFAMIPGFFVLTLVGVYTAYLHSRAAWQPFSALSQKEK